MSTPKIIFRGVLYLWLVTLDIDVEKYCGFHYQILNTDRLISRTQDAPLISISDVTLSSVLSCRCLMLLLSRVSHVRLCATP